MFELLFCASLTVLPDFLIRRYVQDKRIGREIDLFSVWYELRYGITGCLILTILLITTVFYFHPSTSDVTSIFRTVTILPERSGRVKEVYAANGDLLEAGDRIFSMEDDQQRAAVTTAQKRLEEVEAQFRLVEDELAAAQGNLDQARGALKEAQDELEDQVQLVASNSPAARAREVERLQNRVSSRQGAVDAAQANLTAVETKKTTLLPAQRASAEAALEQTRIDLAQSVVYASTSGELQQFALQPGDVVSPVLRTAGILVPYDVGQDVYQAAFNQINAQVLKPGMLAEMTCMSLPFKVVPMRVDRVQTFLPSGQFRPSDQLIDLQDRSRPGSVQVVLKPLFGQSLGAIPRGSTCIANAYTSFQDKLATEDLGLGTRVALHAVDTVGLLHAFILRAQALMLPVRTLVLSGGH